MDKDKIKKNKIVYKLHFSGYRLFVIKRQQLNLLPNKFRPIMGFFFLKEVNKNIGLINGIACCIQDNRHQGYVIHKVEVVLNRYIMQIIAGYKDVNDCDSFRGDGVLKVCFDGEKSFSTLPIAMISVGTTTMMIPASLIIKKIGQRKGFMS